MALFGIRSATKSLWHHVLFILVFASLPTSLLFIAWAYEDHEFTLVRILQIVIVWVIAGIVAALVGWYVILAPIRRRSGRKEK
jgi:hypothetical protein